jgi:hypothetical protein
MKNHIAFTAWGVIIFAALAVLADVAVWFNHKDGPVSLVITPRKNVSVPPGVSTSMFATAYFGDGSCEDITTNTTWSCDSSIGYINPENGIFTATGEMNNTGWITGNFSNLSKQVYITLAWSPYADDDGDGILNQDEIDRGTDPNEVTLLNVKCRITAVQ